MTTKQQLAKKLNSALIIKERTNGDKFYCLADNSPQWMNDVIMQCHEDASELPNDWRYQFISDAASVLSEYETWEDLNHPEPDIYYNQLIKWLSEMPNADWYVNEAVKEFGIDSSQFDLYRTIGYGQAHAKQETQACLISALEQQIEEQEAA